MDYQNNIIFAILFGILSHFVGHAQGTNTTDLKKSSIGVIFSPDHNYRTLTGPTSEQWVVDTRNREERPKFGYTLGMSYQRGIGQRWLLETGVLYADKGFQTNKMPLSWPGPTTDFPTSAKAKHQYHSIHLPLKVNYFFMLDRVRFFISTGLSMDILVAKSTIVAKSYPGGRQAKSSITKTLGQPNFAGLVGLGIDYDISERIRIRLEPTFRYALWPTTLNVPLREHLFAIGANTGIFYTIKRRP